MYTYKEVLPQKKQWKQRERSKVFVQQSMLEFCIIMQTMEGFKTKFLCHTYMKKDKPSPFVA